MQCVGRVHVTAQAGVIKYRDPLNRGSRVPILPADRGPRIPILPVEWGPPSPSSRYNGDPGIPILPVEQGSPREDGDPLLAIVVRTTQDSK